jgi:hypothetical protein
MQPPFSAVVWPKPLLAGHSRAHLYFRRRGNLVLCVSSKATRLFHLFKTRPDRNFTVPDARHPSALPPVKLQHRKRPPFLCGASNGLGRRNCNAAVLANALPRTSCFDEWMIKLVFSLRLLPGIFSLQLHLADIELRACASRTAMPGHGIGPAARCPAFVRPVLPFCFSSSAAMLRECGIYRGLAVRNPTPHLSPSRTLETWYGGAWMVATCRHSRFCCLDGVKECSAPPLE